MPTKNRNEKGATELFMDLQIVTAAIVISNKAVLIARRSPGQSLEGYWEFPGGKIEEGESLQDCLKRELLEELGVLSEVEKDEFCIVRHSYAKGELLLVGLIAYLKSHNFKLSVHDKVEWVPFDDILSYKLAPADVQIAEKIIQSF